MFRNRARDRFRAGSSQFNPASLFAAGENGAWYDPSDLSTLYQDAAGTIPVTADGQPVGLALDKRLGLALGPERVTNGTFDTDLTGWLTGPNIVATHVGGAASVTRTGAVTTTAAFYQDVPVTPGKTYKITLSASGNDIARLISNTSPAITALNEARVGEFQYIVTATSINIRLSFWTFDGGTVIIDNVSVREIQGNHATQTTSTSRPTYQTDGTLHWLTFDGVDDWLVTPTITPGANIAQVMNGMRVTGTGLGIVAELGNDTTSGDIRTYVTGVANTFVAGLRGSSGTGGQATSARTPPYSAVFFANIDGNGLSINDQILLRTNGADDEGATFGGYPGVVSAFSTNPIYIGRRTGTTFPLNGRIYGLIVRFGDSLSDQQRAQSESYLAGKTGVVIA